MLGAEVDLEEASKFGTFVRDGMVGGFSSGTPNDIMSTILETSFAIFRVPSLANLSRLSSNCTSTWLERIRETGAGQTWKCRTEP